MLLKNGYTAPTLYSIPKKTIFYFFIPSTKHQPCSALSITSLDGTVIAETSNTKLLGVVIDNKLNFEAHIHSSTNKTNKKLGMLYRSHQFLTKESRISLASSFLLPTKYGSVIFTNLQTGLMNKLTQTYNKVARFATYSSSSSHHCLSFKTLQWLEVPNQLLFSQLCTAFNLIQTPSQCPALSDLLHKCTPSRCLGSQEQNLLELPTWNRTPLTVFIHNP